MGTMISRGGVALALVAGLLVTASSATAAPLAQSKFTDNVEGWKVIGDSATDPEKPDHIATGGNPGGFAQVTDQAIGGVMFWRAPAKFRGNLIDAYQGTLLFSLTQSATDTQFDDTDIVLEGGGLRLTAQTEPNPPLFPAWGEFGVSLSRPGWLDETNAEAATAKDMRKVLRDLNELLIRAEYRTGDDTDGLDSVKLKKP